VNLVLTASDEDSGIDYTEYSLDAGATWTQGTELTLSDEGLTTVLYRSADLAGNLEEAKSCEVKIDRQAPATTDDADDAWSADPVTIHFSVSEPLSGVDYTEYSTDGGATWTQGDEVAIADEGITTILYRSSDVAGNVEEAKSCEVKIDRTAPATADDADSAWHNGDLTIHFSATDTLSGIDYTEYSVDDGATWTQGSEMTIADEGLTTILYRSADLAGNREEAKSCEVKIDRQAPATTDDADDAWSADPVTIHFSVSEPLSGVDYTEYSTDDGETWTQGDEVTIGDEGVTEILYRSADLAGNVEETRSCEVRIDTVAPTITINAPAEGATYVKDQVIYADYAAVDQGSGIAEVTDSLAFGLTIDTASTGTKTFTVTAIDQVGNTACVTITYEVAYQSGGINQPVNPDGSSVFKINRTVPLKFSITDAEGQPFSGLAPRLYLAKLSDGIWGDEVEAIDDVGPDEGNLFRETAPGTYQYNLRASTLSVGTWRARIELGNGACLYAVFSLR